MQMRKIHIQSKQRQFKGNICIFPFPPARSLRFACVVVKVVICCCWGLKLQLSFSFAGDWDTIRRYGEERTTHSY